MVLRRGEACFVPTTREEVQYSMRYRLMVALILLSCAWMLAAAVTAEAKPPTAKVVVQGLSPKMVADQKLTTGTSSGLPVVGLGETVYLKGVGVPDTVTKTITAYTWAIKSTPTGSKAALSATTGEKITFVPDTTGVFVIGLTVKDSNGETSAEVTQNITSGKWVGVGTIGGATPNTSIGQCGLCHKDKTDEWAKTRHATKVQRNIDTESHYGQYCLQCHTVGYNEQKTAVNNGFDDVQKAKGWVFPDSTKVGKPGNWDALVKNYPDVAALANIQCENCHGPGSEHKGIKDKTAVSISEETCNRCHANLPYQRQGVEFTEKAAHGRSTLAAGGRVILIDLCAQCHVGQGALARFEGDPTLKLQPAFKAADIQNPENVTCAVCHDPHSEKNEHLLRLSGTQEVLGKVLDAGPSKVCMQCHRLRPGSDKPGTRVHESHQTEMLAGVGGYEYPGEKYPTSSHAGSVSEKCVTCHMDTPGQKDPRFAKLGSHTWKQYDDNGTPNDPKDDLYNTLGCEPCHGKLADFNVNGTQSEIEDMLVVLYDLLPHRKDAPAGGWKFPSGVAWSYSATAATSATRQMTQDEVNAAYNYLFVEQDGSEGVHNHRYARKLLADAIKSLRKPVPPGLVGDFNGDKRVDFEDLFLFVAQFGKTSASPDWDARYDLSGNGAIGYVDFYMFLDNFGKTAGSAKPVFVDNGRNSKVGFDIGPTALRSVDNTHFAVQVQAQNATDLRGYGATLSYNPDELEFVRVLRSQNSLLKADGALAPVTVVSNEAGRLIISDAIARNRTASGSGPLAEVVFLRKGGALNPIVKVEAAQVSDGSFGMNRANAGELAAEEAPTKLVNALGQNFPNPFNPTTQIGFGLAEPGRVRLVVYNLLGQVVRDLVDEYRMAGAHAVTWDGKDAQGRQVASGIYLYRIEANKFSAVRRMVLMK